MYQIFGLELADCFIVPLAARLDVSLKSKGFVAEPLFDNFSKPMNAPPQIKRILVVSSCVNSCCGCLRPPPVGNICNRSFQDLEQRLLHAFARNVPGYRRIIILAADLIDLVNVNDPGLCLFYIVAGRLK